ncbi:MAG: PSP1 domain-containing protein [Thermodesulfobacteriota bacterium]
MNETDLQKIVNVSLRKDGGIHEFYTGHFVLSDGDKVIVEANKGLELGTVCSKPRLRHASMPGRPIKKIFRLATQEDIEKKEKNELVEAEAVSYCKEVIKQKGLPMNLIAVELPFEVNKLTFYYTANARVDFRELVKNLVKKFNTHVEMRQIGARDLSRMMGGIGHCGRQLCCSLFLSDFDPISIRMAKDQDLSLNPEKISGVCGRLMCCLSFEHSSYMDRKKSDRGNNGKRRR